MIATGQLNVHDVDPNKVTVAYVETEPTVSGNQHKWVSIGCEGSTLNLFGPPEEVLVRIAQQAVDALHDFHAARNDMSVITPHA